jgi:hypothetical protein
MRSTHLHALGGNVPAGSFDVELFPPCPDQFAGAHKSEGHQLQGQPRDVRTRIDFDGSQQAGQFLGINAGIVGFARGLQNVAGVDFAGRKIGSVAVGNGIAKHLPSGLQGAFGNIPRTALFNGLGHRHQFRRFNFSNGPRAKAGQDICFCASLHVVCMARTLPVPPMLQPKQRDALKGIFRCRLLGLALRHWVYARSQQLACFSVALSSERQ